MEELLRAQAQQEAVPPLPPLLQMILEQTRAKQAAKAAGKDVNDAPEDDDQARLASSSKGPLFLEGPPAGLVVQGTDVPAEHGVERDSEEEDAGAPVEEPAGPIDASKCSAHGPGFSGAAANQPVKLTITARDAAGRRVREGGAHMLVMVEPTAAPGAAEEPEPIQADVVDHGDGTYTASYAVPAKGNYQLHIEVNGDPLGDSPYPIFFSAAQLIVESGAQPAGMAAAGMPGMQAGMPGAQMSGLGMPVPTMTAGGIQIVTAEAIKAAQQQQAAAVAGAVQAAVPGAPGAAAAAMAAAYPNLATGVQISLGTQLAQMGMRFPELGVDQATRVVIIGGITPHAQADALKSVFAFCGPIRSCTLAGANTGCAFIEFESQQAATAALAMSGASLMGQPLKVELASEAKKAADAAATTVSNPYMALQAHQVQQFRLLQQQQTALQEQVLNMRAAARGRAVTASAAAAPNYHSNDSQKSAAIAAALALSKKMAAGGGGGGGGEAANGGGDGEKQRKRSRSRSRSRGGGRRRSSRSRSRDQRRRDSRGRGGAPSDRKRSRSRDRKRGGRSRSRSRDRRRGGGGSGHKDSHKESHKERKQHKHGRREKDRRRSRSRSRGRGRDDKKRSNGSKDDAGADGGPTKMDVDAAPAQPKQEQEPKGPTDELEALLEELGE